MQSSTTHTNILGRISHYFMVNRPLSILVLIATLIFGLVAFLLTPKQYNPEIQRPAFAITLVYSGATIEQSLDRVVYELIEKVSSVPGVDDVYTEVSDGAKITTTVIFDVGHDTTKAKVDLLTQLEQHAYLAKGFISPPSIMEINPETIPVLQVVFGSSQTPVAEVRKNVVEISKALTNLEGVSDVHIVGGFAPALIVEVDPVKLSAYNLTIDEVVGVLRESQTRFVSSGYSTGDQRIEIVYDGRVDSPSALGTLLVRGTIHLRDVANIYEGTTKERSYVLHKKTGEEAGEVVMLAISKVEGSSAKEVTGRVRDTLATETAQDEYQRLSYSVVGDDGVTAQREIYGLTFNLMSSIAIVVIVLLLFLSVRAAGVVLVAIPMTLLVVFGIGYLFDQTINRITLFALILSLGLLVDSAIVVVENIYSNLKNDTLHTRQFLVTKAVHEVGVGLVLSAVTSVIVFLPMNFITGMMGPYMGPIAFYVPVALIVSLIIAIVVIPFIALHLVQPNEKKSWIALYVDRGMSFVTEKYKTILVKILSSRTLQKRILGSVLAFFVLSLLLPLFGLVHFQMLPRADRDQFYVYIDTPVQTATETTKKLAEKVAELLTSDTDVVHTQIFVAQSPVVDFSGMFKGAQNRTGTHQATLRVNLTPSNTRARSSTEIVSDAREQLTHTIPTEASFVRFAEEPPGPPVRATLVAKVSSRDKEVANHFSQELYDLFGRVEGVVDRYSSQEPPTGSITYTLNQDRAESADVTSHSVSTTLQLLRGSMYVAEYVASDINEYTPLLVELPFIHQDSPADIGLLNVRSQKGELVPILSILDTSYTVRETKVYLEGAVPVTYVTGEVENRSVVYVVIESVARLLRGELANYKLVRMSLFSMDFEDTQGTTVTLAWGGEWEMTLENFRDLGVAMFVAILLVYTVLVAQYNSFSKPAYILVTVPLSLIGILWGFFFLDTFFGIYLTATALIGFIALIGIVVNNAIIFLEYVEQAQESGVDFETSLLTAGTERLRPILLTSLTTILGSLTIASDPVWSGLAWSIIFGLSLSTILTLGIYPTVLVFFRNHNSAPEKARS